MRVADYVVGSILIVIILWALLMMPHYSVGIVDDASAKQVVITAGGATSPQTQEIPSDQSSDNDAKDHDRGPPICCFSISPRSIQSARTPKLVVCYLMAMISMTTFGRQQVSSIKS